MLFLRVMAWLGDSGKFQCLADTDLSLASLSVVITLLDKLVVLVDHNRRVTGCVEFL